MIGGPCYRVLFKSSLETLVKVNQGKLTRDVSANIINYSSRYKIVAGSCADRKTRKKKKMKHESQKKKSHPDTLALSYLAPKSKNRPSESTLKPQKKKKKEKRGSPSCVRIWG